MSSTSTVFYPGSQEMLLKKLLVFGAGAAWQQGWVVSNGIKVLAAIHVVQSLYDEADVIPQFQANWKNSITGVPEQSPQVIAQIGVSWGLGAIPPEYTNILNTPGAVGIIGVAETSVPTNLVNSLTLVSTQGAVEYSINQGNAWIAIAQGTRTWASKPATKLDVSNMRFRGTLSSSMYELIYEV